MKLRSILFWLHLIGGVSAGVVILIMSVTGVLLTYQRQITAWSDSHTYRVEPHAGSTRLSVEELIACLRDARPDMSAASITLSADPAAPVMVAGATATAPATYLDPYSGSVLGEAKGQNVRAFFRSVTDWHRWLATSIESRPKGRMATGISNFIFLCIVGSGVFLWWPKAFSWRSLRSITWFRRGLPGKARDFNWHNTIGFWSAVPLVVIVGSGVVMSYPWANALVYRMAGEHVPAAGGGGGGGAAARPAPARPQGQGPAAGGAVDVAGLDPLWETAQAQMPGWQTISLRIPTSRQAPVVFTIDAGNGGQPAKRATLTLNRRTGEVVRWEPFSSLTAGRRARSWLRFAHTGEVYGVVGQTIAGLASLGGVVLVYTGLALAFRRCLAWIRRRKYAAQTQTGLIVN